ncbi:prephenate dehydratase [Rhizobium sp. BK196]|jgi:prephenate dehydratase|uniref:hypothetical protein n=1 Tax=Rhizobium sp. BK196 TaxID=2587073 RepID=UPI00160F14FA|nr:hypothetical protein [Rhizobium sp. BK196]MBB3313108.1 prephenate dehydratase [Rhizobium sp. BK196]
MSIEGYHREKFASAVSNLVGLGDIRTRVEHAFVSLVTVDPTKMIGETGKKYQALHAKVTSRPEEAEGEGTIRSTLHHMTEEDVSGVAEEILEIHNQLLRDFSAG